MRFITFKLQKDELKTLIELLDSEIKSTVEFLSGDSIVLIDNVGTLDPKKNGGAFSKTQLKKPKERGGR